MIRRWGVWREHIRVFPLLSSLSLASSPLFRRGREGLYGGCFSCPGIAQGGGRGSVRGGEQQFPLFFRPRGCLYVNVCFFDTLYVVGNLLFLRLAHVHLAFLGRAWGTGQGWDTGQGRSGGGRRVVSGSGRWENSEAGH